MHNVGSEMNKMYFIFVYCILLLLFFFNNNMIRGQYNRNILNYLSPQGATYNT